MFFGPKTLHVTLFFVTWPCSYATLRHVNWTSFIIIIIIIIIAALCKVRYVVFLRHTFVATCGRGDRPNADATTVIPLIPERLS